ncbi:hypothetical protein [Natranaerobius thermophilus]|uniref:hypothetical protein n=1 Tax=Natranaerobius thermophilus TaxID=375929 RepID=UPI00130E729E|nr:hypothetical protein [Natranaerobius thermophilus]
MYIPYLILALLFIVSQDIELALFFITFTVFIASVVGIITALLNKSQLKNYAIMTAVSFVLVTGSLTSIAEEDIEADNDAFSNETEQTEEEEEKDEKQEEKINELKDKLEIEIKQFEWETTAEGTLTITAHTNLIEGTKVGFEFIELNPSIMPLQDDYKLTTDHYLPFDQSWLPEDSYEKITSIDEEGKAEVTIDISSRPDPAGLAIEFFSSTITLDQKEEVIELYGDRFENIYGYNVYEISREHIEDEENKRGVETVMTMYLETGEETIAAFPDITEYSVGEQVGDDPPGRDSILYKLLN